MTVATSARIAATPDWLGVLRRYFLFSLIGHLLWEVAHIPLYTIWTEGSAGEIIFAIVHCTGGDLMIAFSTLLVALFLFGRSEWPRQRSIPVLMATVVMGVGYTIFSEWLNIVVREAWAYRDIMPVIPVIDAGLTPFLQWLVVPTAAYLGATSPRAWRR
ncbi:MAG: hypothetical protein ACU0E9_09805 [Limimaricola soesokkakensis]|jgi:hypothetical protein|uniref:hypothetical protein n=1 Tax=Limimaricola TaxID=2211638 RepID=UPI002AC92DD7|nr:hypothetical protein [Limimaricola variabilis]WPY96940.1 hypothetical protein T8T21_20395 [Limimaricola variabilis]